MKLKGLVFVCIVMCASMVMAAAQVLVIVNDAPISSFDVDQRIKLLQFQKREGNESSEKQKKVALNQLVDDQLKVSEAQKNNLTVSDKEVDDAVERLAKQNGLTVEELEKKLKDKGVYIGALKSQAKADLLWLSVLRSNKGLVSEVSDSAVDNRTKQIKKEMSQEGFMVAEIFVKDEGQANSVFDEIRRDMPFDEMAKKVSLSASADRGGYIGWVNGKNYPKEVIDVLRQMKSKQMSKPIKTKDGYYIVLLLDKKEAGKEYTMPVWELVQMATVRAKTVELMPEIMGLSNCEAFEKFADKNAVEGSFQRGFTGATQLPAELSQLLAKEGLNVLVGPVTTPQGDISFMKCQEQEKSMVPSKDEIRSQLEMEQMMLLTDRLLRDIRRYAVIEYK